MNEFTKLDGLVPERLKPKTHKIVLQDYVLPVDIGFHDFEVGHPQRLAVTVEVWLEEAAFAARDGNDIADVGEEGFAGMGGAHPRGHLNSDLRHTGYGADGFCRPLAQEIAQGASR